MSKALFVVSALLLILLMVACAPKAAPAPELQAPPPAAAPAPAPSAVRTAPAKPSWEIELQRVLAEAKKEGKVTLVYGGIAPSVRIAEAEGFKKAYGISAESVSAKSGQLLPKIIAERRAGIYSYDIAMLGTSQITGLKPEGALAPLEPAFILPDVTDPELIKKTWRGGSLRWVDSDHTVLAPALGVSLPIAINTNLVKEGEIKSWRDLLSPKWKGKMLMTDPTTGGFGGQFLQFVNSVLGWDYLGQLLGTAQPMVLADERLALDWLVHGKVAVVMPPDNTTLIELMKAVAPVKGLIPAEGTWLMIGANAISSFDKPPHPNVAKVFINWFVSKEAQTIAVVPLGSQSLRLDVPVDHLPADQQLHEGKKYFFGDEKAILEQPALQKKAKEMLAPLVPK